jgi:hypothetical protein
MKEVFVVDVVQHYQLFNHHHVISSQQLQQPIKGTWATLMIHFFEI